jgi:chromatin segregation and condensation protein Rec8/ScpA/Scc1 (kleisin family)
MEKEVKLIPEEKSEKNPDLGSANKEKIDKVGQDQIYDMLVSRELSWQALLLDLINTERLNPWDIDLSILAQRYVEKIRELQDLGENAFFISSKVLLAAAILLRIKSEILHENIRDIDEILFESKKKMRDELVKNPQIITLEEDEIPLIMPRTPLPRARKVTLPELMSALDKAINTEHRRIKKSLYMNRARRDIGIAIFPRFTFNITQKIKDIFGKIKELFMKKNSDKLVFSELVSSNEKTERIPVFLSLVHLDHQKKIWLEQEQAFSELQIYLKKQRDLGPEDCDPEVLEKEAQEIENLEGEKGEFIGEHEEVKMREDKEKSSVSPN